MNNASSKSPDLDIEKQLRTTLQDLSKAIRHPALPYVKAEPLSWQIELPKPLSDSVQESLNQSQIAKALDGAGWLPHYTTPFGQVEACSGDRERITEVLKEHYEGQWSTVCQTINAHLAECCLDAEARETFQEALSAHERRLYRCVCRVLFPEIEGVVRRLFPNYETADSITIRTELHDAGLQVLATSFKMSPTYLPILFKRLSAHLYSQIRNDDAIKAFSQDPIPNRHAAIHGLVKYSESQHSLNTIFVTDFIFQIISGLNKLQATSEENQ